MFIICVIYMYITPFHYNDRYFSNYFFISKLNSACIISVIIIKHVHVIILYCAVFRNCACSVHSCIAHESIIMSIILINAS